MVQDRLRQEIIKIHKEKKLSHAASALSCADIIWAIYEIKKPEDKFILSKGHAWYAWYMVCKMKKLSLPAPPSCSLGNGLGIGCGMAKAGYKAYVVLSDGECQEGSTWEAAMFAGHHQLENLTTIIDCNKFQACGKIKDIIDVEPLQEKWWNFGWDTVRVDGHDPNKLINTLQQVSYKRPSLIIADTIKGKGLKRGENSNLYHYKIPG